MTKIKTGYKVFIKRKDNLLSAIIPIYIQSNTHYRPENELGLIYNKEKRNYHNLLQGSLAVFDTLLKAINFLHRNVRNSYYVIYKVKYRPTNNTLSFISKEYGKLRLVTHNSNKSPLGTRFAVWIKIIGDEIEWM